MDAVSHCHSKGVYHRDLKPGNLLLDSCGNLKVSDFGLSALPKQGVDLLHRTCGMPNYVVPEVLNGQGYDGAAADVWSCGVILYVPMAGYLPFEETDLPILYKKISAAEFTCPFWFSPSAKLLIDKILDPNPKTRIKIEGIRSDPWFRQNFIPVRHGVEEVNLDDVHAVVEDIETRLEGVSANTTGQFAVVLEVFEVAPSLFMVDVRKAAGETLEYRKDYLYVPCMHEHRSRGKIVMRYFQRIEDGRSRQFRGTSEFEAGCCFFGVTQLDNSVSSTQVEFVEFNKLNIC
ncbi:Son of sevenless 2 [Ancistrocladus abbreviatus]